MELKNFFPDSLLSLFEKFPFLTFGTFFFFGCVLLIVPGNQFASYILEFGVVVFINMSVVQYIDSRKKSYDNISYRHSNEPLFDKHKNLFNDHIKVDKFQYLAIAEGTVLKFIALIPSQEEAIEFKKRNEVFLVIKKSIDSCSDGLLQEIGSVSGNVLRYTYDLHPGGGFVFGDCNIPSKQIFVFGFTNSQKNVNSCSNDMGKIIDKIRLTYGLPPIAEINDKKK